MGGAEPFEGTPPDLAQPLASIVVAVRDGVSLTRLCLDRLVRERRSGELEIVVVDDGSTDGAAELLAGRGDEVRVVSLDSRADQAVAWNAGAAAASASLLVFTTSGYLPEPGALGALVEYAGAHAEADLVGSTLLLPDDTVQHVGIVVTQQRLPRHLYVGFPADEPAVSKSRPMTMVRAEGALVRRDAFAAADGFDDGFGRGYEGLDLALRIRRRGGGVHICGDSVFYALSDEARLPPQHPWDEEVFIRRWGRELEPDDVRYYLDDELLHFTYPHEYPLELEVSPLLAVPEKDGGELERLLARRSRRLTELRRENLELRLGGSPYARPDGLSEQAAVLFVTDAAGDLKRYRSDHQAEQLRLLGAAADVAMTWEVDLDHAADRYGCFVFQRVLWSDDMRSFLAELRRRGRYAIFDTDDLIFDRQALLHVAALADMPAYEREHFEEGIGRYRQMMLACNAVTVSTSSLHDAAGRIHPNVFVVPNVADGEMLELADRARERAAAREGVGVTVAYLSGTHTHNRDFLEAADAVLDVLGGQPEVSLLVVGHLELDERFDAFPDQVRRLPLQPWRRLFDVLATVDVNLAPLEPENPFTEAKSCIKYIEAGLVGVPTIASPRSDFVRAIRHGENGLLAEGPEEWTKALTELVNSPEGRRRIGEAAYEDVRRRHTTRALAGEYYAAFAEAVRGRRSSLRIDWVVGDANSDGMRSVGARASELAERGHRQRLVVLEGVAEELLSGPLAAAPLEVLVGHERIGPADLGIATDWRAAYAVSASPRLLFKHYLPVEGPADVNGDEEAAAQAAQASELPLRILDAGGSPAEFEARLLDACFARLGAVGAPV